MSTEPQILDPLDRWFRFRQGLSGSMMDYLYNAMDGMYPGSWSDKFKTEQSIQNWRQMWAARFEEEGLNPRQVKNGIDQCPALYVNHVPTLGEFIIACRTVTPQCHRDFPVALLTNKGTPEGRAAGLRMMREAMAEIEERRRQRELEKA